MLLKASKISFPGLGIGEFEVNSEAFSLFGHPIAWYALIITCGMIIAVLYTVFRAKKIGIVFDDVLDLAIAAIPVGIIGARLYYVLTTLEDFHSFKEVFAIWNGGLAIYGGIIGGALAVLVVCLCKKINFFAFADCCTPGIIMAQAIGRWGNFMNGEAFGGLTDSFLRMGLSNDITRYTFHTSDMVYVHPTFLYESLWNVLGFILINIFYKHKKYDGQIMLMVFGWYGLGRMIIEGLRTDSLWIGPFGVLTVVFLVVLAAAIGFLVYLIPQILAVFRERSVTSTQKALFIADGSAILLSVIMIILDSAVIKSFTAIPEQRVSQVLACLIFIICGGLLIYFTIRKPTAKLYYRTPVEANNKK